MTSEIVDASSLNWDFTLLALSEGKTVKFTAENFSYSRFYEVQKKLHALAPDRYGFSWVTKDGYIFLRWKSLDESLGALTKRLSSVKLVEEIKEDFEVLDLRKETT